MPSNIVHLRMDSKILEYLINNRAVGDGRVQWNTTVYEIRCKTVIVYYEKNWLARRGIWRQNYRVEMNPFQPWCITKPKWAYLSTATELAICLSDLYYLGIIPQFHKTGWFSASLRGPTQHIEGKGPPACESVSLPATQRKPDEKRQTISVHNPYTSGSIRWGYLLLDYHISKYIGDQQISWSKCDLGSLQLPNSSFITFHQPVNWY